MKNKKQLNLYKSYKRSAKTTTNRNLFLSPAAPAVLLAVLGLIVWAIFLRINMRISADIDDLNAYFADESVIAKYNESLEKQAYNESLLAQIDEAKNLSDALATYPLVDSKLLARIAAVGGEEVTMHISGYNAQSGELEFDVRSYAVIDIPDYVLALNNTALFERVEYSGYEYDNEEYILRLRCMMRADAGR